MSSPVTGGCLPFKVRRVQLLPDLCICREKYEYKFPRPCAIIACMSKSDTVRAMPVAMSVAGSDSGAGAGIQADLLTFAAHGVYGTTAITCLTAQNPDGVSAVQAATPEFVAAQLSQLAGYFDIRAMKTGMLFDSGIVRAVCAFMETRRDIPAVVDPVMVATSGAALLCEEAMAAVRGELLPLATLITPNLDEAAVILGQRPQSVDEMRDAARMLHVMCSTAVLLKGGHLDSGDSVTDILYTADGTMLEFSDERIRGVNTHGSGCTLSAAICAGLAKGMELPEAVFRARHYLMDGMRKGLNLGRDTFIAHLP